MRSPLSLAVLIVLCAACNSPSTAADLDPNELELKTERVIIFKDGYCLVIKRGTATTDADGVVFTDQVPDAAVLGSFWAVPDEGRLVSINAGWKVDESTETREFPCKEHVDILVANQGKEVKVELHDKTIHSGTIHAVLVDENFAPLVPDQWEQMIAATRPGAASPRFPVRDPGTLAWINETRTAAAEGRVPAETRFVSTNAASNFILRTADADVLLPIGQIRSLQIKEMKTTLTKTLKVKKNTKRLSLKFPAAEKQQSVALMYFRPGIRWIPTYRINLADNGKKMAQIALQAELLNEAEDLKDVPIDIVVGVPNFRFKGTPSPLVLEATLRNALAEAAPAIMGQAMANNSFSNAMYSQRSSEFRRTAAAANDAAERGIVNLPGELTATGAQDLFVYQLPKISLARGERVAVPIFATEAPYKDIYTWDVQVTRADIEAAPSGAGVVSPLTLSKNEVWHQVIITNNTNLPWTTGAAMITQGDQPLAQELLTYTPPKDECRVPVTIAVDARGSFDEHETRRDLNALSWDGYQYAKITKEANVHLCNNKKVPINVEMTVRIGGKVTETTEEGKIVLGAFRAEDWQNYRGNPAVNNGSTVTWTATLKPGETIEPVVSYFYFTRH
jgi:hypothetical protein